MGRVSEVSSLAMNADWSTPFVKLIPVAGEPKSTAGCCRKGNGYVVSGERGWDVRVHKKMSVGRE
jgi:hypothetical protein